jgi:hypothetical protein
MGYLTRRNILAYKAPPNDEGYDLICIHPNPRRVTRQIRVQVKSRLATDHGGGFPVKACGGGSRHESVSDESRRCCARCAARITQSGEDPDEWVTKDE